jgi:AmpE protein
MNVVIFYYCLGPENPFYPVLDGTSNDNVGDYFAKVNQGLFSRLPVPYPGLHN